MIERLKNLSNIMEKRSVVLHVQVVAFHQNSSP
jgi:hypothetical protein